MRVAVTGNNGQVARSLAERAGLTGDEVLLLGRPALELAGEAEHIVAALSVVEPDVIVSAAAYTIVDKAESEPELAYMVNATGAKAVASAAAMLGVPLIHLSTDYVFDGAKADPYLESDPTSPVGVYGASKLAGEEAVIGVHGDSAILRTAWVYSPFGSNFVKTMLRLASERDEIAVVSDQIGNPTSALDIADAVLAVAGNLVATPDPNQRGIFHLVSSGQASWAQFAERIFSFSEQAGGPTARINAISSADYPTAAQRPANSRLNADRISRAHGVRLPHWHQSLEGVVRRLVATENNRDHR